MLATLLMLFYTPRRYFLVFLLEGIEASLLLVQFKVEYLMYAVIISGGKQHRVVEGETLRLEKLDVAEGTIMNFTQVLMLGEGASVQIGTPLVEGSKVLAEVVGHKRDQKVKVIKFRRRKHSRTQQGHRQWYTEVKIKEIVAG